MPQDTAPILSQGWCRPKQRLWHCAIENLQGYNLIHSVLRTIKCKLTLYTATAYDHHIDEKLMEQFQCLWTNQEIIPGAASERKSTNFVSIWRGFFSCRYLCGDCCTQSASVTASYANFFLFERVSRNVAVIYWKLSDAFIDDAFSLSVYYGCMHQS